MSGVPGGPSREYEIRVTVIHPPRETLENNIISYPEKGLERSLKKDVALKSLPL